MGDNQPALLALLESSFLVQRSKEIKMSLSEIIIYEDSLSLRKILASNSPPMNVIDEYGYTPLIQTAIVNDPEKTKLILQQEADPNFSDLVGRVGLHWAADNNNFTLCLLLLKAGADPNLPTMAGQSPLVMPLLRGNKKISSLLIEYGASIDFANDFIMAKLLAHRFNMGGHVDILDNQKKLIEINLEGFFLEFSLSAIIQSFREFSSSIETSDFFEASKNIKLTNLALKRAESLIKFQHYSVDTDKHDQEIESIIETEPIFLPVACQGHVISLVKLHSLLIYCDRGELGRNRGSSIIVYHLPIPELITPGYIKRMLFTRQDRSFFESEMLEFLHLKPLCSLPLKIQRVGNCSWSNTEGAILILLFLSFYSDLPEIEEKKRVQLSFKKAKLIFERWQAWDRHIALTRCFDSFECGSKERKLTKCALLATLVVQMVEDQNDPYLMRNTKAILDLLTNPKYNYILKIYWRELNRNQKNINLVRKLSEILDEAGFDVNKWFDWKEIKSD